MKIRRPLGSLEVPPGKRISLRKDYDPAWIPKGLYYKETEEARDEGIQILAKYQDMPNA